jgi:hypothetical protein
MKEIKLTQGKVALVDDADYDFLNQWKWNTYLDRNTYYAKRGCTIAPRKQITLMMHRLIMGVTNPKVFVDHIDHDGLNNQRSNLRISNCSQNCANRRPSKDGNSKYLGVHFTPRINRWQATIVKGGKSKYIGVFKSEEDAAKAYDAEAMRIHGEFANLNFKSL